ncbi:MAG: tRNA pseudouridine(13) synthase TruD [Candidatus Micrarchaeota archaeon]
MEYNYLSKTHGIGGKMKQKPEDFVVEEIMQDGTVLEINKKVERAGEEGKFTHFVLQKTDWSTAGALERIARKIRTSQRRFNFAGTKDKQALTTQLVSCFGKWPRDFENLMLKDIDILGAWEAKDKVRLGELLGNRFTIRVDGCNEDSESVVAKIYSELGGKFPNYFGEQRFGTTRKNTHIIGEKLLRGQLEDAALSFLCDTEGEEHEAASNARKELLETRDFNIALKNFPRHLRLERSMIARLATDPTDFANAFRKLPRNILLLFVHAFQSHLFNTMLSERIAEGGLEKEDGEYFCGEAHGFPDIEQKQEQENSIWLVGRIVGYETVLNKREKELLERFGMDQEVFRMKTMPEINTKGTYRTLMAPLADFKFASDIFNFSLPSGCYATTALREFLDTKPASLGY